MGEAGAMSWESMGSCYEYIKGTITGIRTIEIYLPKKNPVCSRCMYFREHTLERYSCRLTEEWIFNPTRDRDNNCLIKWSDE